MARATAATELVPASLEPTSAARIRELDGLRGVAILAVLCHHVLFTTVPDQDLWSRPVRMVEAIAHAGIYGVDLFFVLSGFLITSILLADRSRPHFYWNFYWRRALRILPLYLVVLVALGSLFPPTRRYLLLASLFLANFEHIFHLQAFGPFWTLSIEEQFYLLWPRISRHMAVARLRRLSIGVAALCLGLRMVDALFGHYNYRFTFFHCDGLAMGAALACELWQMRQQDRAWRIGRSVLWTALAGLVLIVPPLTLPRTERQMVLTTPFILTGVNLLGYSAVKIAVVCSGAGFLAVLRSRVLVFFGLISYAVYMLNEYVIFIFDVSPARIHLGSTTGYFMRFAVLVVAIVMVGVVSRYVIELPAMSLRRYVLRRS